MSGMKVMACIAAAVLLTVLFGGGILQRTEMGETLPRSGAETGEYHAAEPVGEVPLWLQGVMARNLFADVTVCDGCLLRRETLPAEKENQVIRRVQKLDLHGNELAACEITCDECYDIWAMTALKDGGFLFVLGFSDWATDRDSRASDDGFASRVIRCGADGQILFDTALPGLEGGALVYCFETGEGENAKYCLFGTAETPETKRRGIASPGDIYMLMLDARGAVLKERRFGGTDFDDLRVAERSGDGFLLSVWAQSEDGDFAGSGSNGYPVDWVITVNDEFEVTAMEKRKGRSILNDPIGFRDGAPVYRDEAFPRGFDAGTPVALIDEGDVTLVVSENITGIYEDTPPYISAIWYYTETVYSGYDAEGRLLFRAAVDSTPEHHIK